MVNKDLSPGPGPNDEIFYTGRKFPDGTSKFIKLYLETSPKNIPFRFWANHKVICSKKIIIKIFYFRIKNA